MSPRIKRRRGGQPGNQNARKHGFFSSSLSPQELCAFWQNLKTSGDTPLEIVALRTKLISALRASPGNRRIIQDTARLMAKWTISQDPKASRRDKAEARKVIRFVCSEIGKLSSETIESITPEKVQIFTERIQAEMVKWL